MVHRRHLRTAIRLLRRLRAADDPRSTHRDAVLLMLSYRPPWHCAAAIDVMDLCFEQHAGIAWSPEQGIDLLREMEHRGEVLVDWQQRLDGTEEPVWVWLARPAVPSRPDSDPITYQEDPT